MRNFFSSLLLSSLFVGNLAAIVGAHRILPTFIQNGTPVPQVSLAWERTVGSLGAKLGDLFASLPLTANVYVDLGIVIAAFTLLFYVVCSVIEPSSEALSGTMSILVVLLLVGAGADLLPFGSMLLKGAAH